MRRGRVTWLLAGLLILPILQAGAAGPAHIAIISRAYAPPFWQAVMRGAEEAARDYGVTVSFAAPEDESMADEQAAMVSDALAASPSALCIDALDSSKIIPLLQKARRARIPVIGFDEGAASPVLLTTAATDNAAAAALAANKMAAILGGTGAVGLIVRDQATRTGIDRRDGFLNEMKKRYPAIRITGPSYSGGDAKTAADIARAMLQADPGLRGLFAGDEQTAAGVLSAVQELGAAGRVVVVGFDSGQAQVDAVRSGLMAGAVTQDPIRIGYRTVEAAVDALNGKRVPPRIDTGFHWYDRTNIDDPSISVLLHP
jgi:ribose transport system substrate-binding protein